jgi:DNA polymerase III subunit chi
MNTCIFHDCDSMQRERSLFEAVESGYEQRKRVLVYAESTERAVALDRVLWINKQESFIPHGIIEEAGAQTDLTVVIVTGEFDPVGAAILVADGHCSLEFAAGFERVHEFVDHSRKEASRERFRAYKTLGFKVDYVKPGIQP